MTRLTLLLLLTLTAATSAQSDNYAPQRGDGKGADDRNRREFPPDHPHKPKHGPHPPGPKAGPGPKPAFDVAFKSTISGTCEGGDKGAPEKGHGFEKTCKHGFKADFLGHVGTDEMLMDTHDRLKATADLPFGQGFEGLMNNLIPEKDILEALSAGNDDTHSGKSYAEWGGVVKVYYECKAYTKLSAADGGFAKGMECGVESYKSSGKKGNLVPTQDKLPAATSAASLKGDNALVVSKSETDVPSEELIGEKLSEFEGGFKSEEGGECEAGTKSSKSIGGHGKTCKHGFKFGFAEHVDNEELLIHTHERLQHVAETVFPEGWMRDTIPDEISDLLNDQVADEGTAEFSGFTYITYGCKASVNKYLGGKIDKNVECGVESVKQSGKKDDARVDPEDKKALPAVELEAMSKESEKLAVESPKEKEANMRKFFPGKLRF